MLLFLADQERVNKRRSLRLEIFDPNSQSKLNHLLLTKQVIYLRAIKPVKAGDELTICYVDQGMLTADRLQHLKEQYYFDCKCNTCETKDKDVVKTAYIMPDEDVPEKTKNYVTKNTEIMLKKIENSKKVQAWERVAKQAGGLLMQQENLFDDTHLKVGKNNNF